MSGETQDDQETRGTLAMGHPAAPRAMRRAKREVTDLAELRDIFEHAHVVRIGATDAEGMFITPMNFGVEWGEPTAGDQAPCTLWLHCANEGRKADAWRACPEVAFELDVEGGVIEGSYSCAYSFAFESVMGTGALHEVTDREHKVRGLAAIMSHMAPGSPVRFSDEAVDTVGVWRLDVTRMTGKRREGMPHAKAVTGGGVATAAEHGAPAKHGTPAERVPKKEERVHRHSSAFDRLGIPRTKKGEGREHDAEYDKEARKQAAKERERRAQKALEAKIAETLAGERCPGCGRHCMLTDPSCGKGKKLRAKRLAEAGLES